jgi:hypothetical protein
MAQHGPEVFRAQAKMFPEAAAGAWAHAATDIPASTGFGTFDEMLAKDVLQTKLLKSLAGPLAGFASIFNSGSYIYGDLMNPDAEWHGTEAVLSGGLAGGEALVSGENWVAIESIPGAGEVAAALGGGWALGSLARHEMPNSWNEGIGNGLLSFAEHLGYQP